MTLEALVVVEFQRTTGIARDAVENTFAFVAQTGTAIDFDAIKRDLRDFYTNTNVHHTLEFYLADTIDKTVPAQLHCYDLHPLLVGPPGSVLGPPVHEDTFGLTGTTGLTPALPDTAAACLSFETIDALTVPEHAPGARPRARHRGRVFLGPLQTAATEVVGGFLRLKGAFQEDLQACASTLESTLADDGNAFWAVWSRKDKTVREVTHGWIDNRIDNQRRRDVEATSRLLWP
jgi:hypothetical protein